jgi:hypothetical protein
VLIDGSAELRRRLTEGGSAVIKNSRPVVAVAAILAALALTAGCGGNNDNGGTPTQTPAATGGPANNTEAQCLEALRKLYQEGAANPDGPTPTPPDACVGLDEKTIERLVGQVLDEALGGLFSDSPSPT